MWEQGVERTVDSIEAGEFGVTRFERPSMRQPPIRHRAAPGLGLTLTRTLTLTLTQEGARLDHAGHAARRSS